MKTFLALMVSGFWVWAAHAEDPAVAVKTLKIQEHRFVPEEVLVPAGEKHMIEIENLDATAEEFESYTLHREKIVPPNGKAKIVIGPLRPGRYEFIGEFNSSTARGVVVAQ